MKKTAGILIAIGAAFFLGVGLFMKLKRGISISIAGEDGPTAVFLAGRLGRRKSRF